MAPTPTTNTPSSRAVRAMVLPAFDLPSGEVTAQAGLWRDVRVPVPVDRDWPARLVGAHVKPAECPHGRHLWDAIEACGNETTPDPDDGEAGWYGDGGTPKNGAGIDGWPTQAFRLHLTCVRCGLVERMTGIRRTDRETTARAQVDPTPLTAGRLVAQQVCADQFGAGLNLASYTVHHAEPGEPFVGRITWRRGPRGRHYYTGHLNCWPDGQHVQAPTPAGCLRKLAAQTPSPASGAARVEGCR